MSEDNNTTPSQPLETANNTPPSQEITDANDYANNQLQNPNQNHISLEITEQATYDGVQNIMDQQKQITIHKNEELIKEAVEKEEKEAKEKEQKKAKVMGMKNPDFSLGWTLADTRCYMVTLQFFVAFACAVLLFMSYSQMTFDADNKCDESTNKYNRPYFGDKSGDTFACPWPINNSIIRMISPGIGLIFALITILLSYWKGSAILKDMKANNDTREKVNKLEYFDIYNQYITFKFMRFVIGLCAYLQFISVGFDAYSYLVGSKYILSEHKVANEDLKFQMVIGISLVVAKLLRVSHDAMYQRVYKHKLKFKLNLEADKGYAGATVVDKENKIPVVEMGDTHHLAPTQNDLAVSVHAQQRQYLEHQNRILTTSSVVPSVYSDNAPSVYSQTQLYHVNAQTMPNGLTHQNLQQLHQQNMSAGAVNVAPNAPSMYSQSQYKQ